MNIHAITSVFLATADIEAACRLYERLGLRLTHVSDQSKTLYVGDPAHRFAVHFLMADAPGPLTEPLRRAVADGRSLFAVGLRVPDVGAAVRHLSAVGVPVAPFRVGDEIAWLPLHDLAGTDVVLVGDGHDPTSPSEHTLPLRRLDHLAAVAHDLEAKTRFWTDVLGVPLSGEITTPALVIRQFRIGDATMELLGPATLDSPIARRPPGLVGMASWEVANLDAAVAHVRAVGFTATDAAEGVLPGTRIATVQGSELAGVNMQLLQYV